MSLNTQSFTTLVSNFATAVQSSASALVNFTKGSVLRAVAEATSGVALWLQGLIVQLLATIRLSTSSSTDVDSWLADFGFTRLPATAASGLVTFSRATTTSQAVIPVGTLVQSNDGTLQFIINADPTNAAYSATIISGGGFIIPAGTASISATATCVTPGTSGPPDSNGNVLANTITSLASAIPYVDTVTNPATFINGALPESDGAVRVRFVLWINSLTEGTLLAVDAAIAGVQQGLTYLVLPNQQYNGTKLRGFFTVVVNDGSGHPPSSLLTAVTNAVNPVKPLGSSFGVFGPNLIPVNVVMNIASAPGYTHSTVTTAVQSAIQTFINSLGFGQALLYTQLASVAWGVAGVSGVSLGYTVNGGTTDLNVSGVSLLQASTITVN